MNILKPEEELKKTKACEIVNYIRVFYFLHGRKVVSEFHTLHFQVHKSGLPKRNYKQRDAFFYPLQILKGIKRVY